MSNCSKCQFRALDMQSVAKRISSAENLIDEKEKGLLDSSIIDKLATLRMIKSLIIFAQNNKKQWQYQFCRIG